MVGEARKRPKKRRRLPALPRPRAANCRNAIVGQDTSLADVPGGGPCRGRGRRSWHSAPSVHPLAVPGTWPIRPPVPKPFVSVQDRHPVRPGRAVAAWAARPDDRLSDLVVSVPGKRGAGNAGKPQDRDMHPICTLRAQASRWLRLARACKCLKNKEKIWSR